MTNPDLQPGKPVQTRDGREAVIYAVHEGQKHPIHCAYKDENGEWTAFVMCADGSVLDDGVRRPLDIIPVPKKLTGFINVHPEFVYETRAEADRAAGCSRRATGRDPIACIDLSEHNLTEGHGMMKERNNDQS